jgi:LuxR family maltose regulon positive regulatory protein
LIAQGEAPAALRLLGEWLLEAQEQGRMRSVLEIKIIMSIAFADHDDLTRARQTLIEALILAQPEGYQRIFLDEGDKFAKLLQAILSQVNDESLKIYSRALLHTFAQEQVRRTALLKASPELIVEPLSDQEQRVLRLLSAGRSNPDIASELVISVNTVKTHVKNIYSKLGVNSREQARQTARYLKSH